MPELPDLELYLHALRPRVLGRAVESIRVISPFVCRSVEPPIATVVGRTVGALRRLGKRIVLGLDENCYLVFHLMVAGRLRWSGRRIPGPKTALAAFEFASGTLLFTEAGTRKQASLHVVRGDASLAEHDAGGLEVLAASWTEFADALRRENHTLKRALTDPRLVAGIGNAYSDEILHAAQLSPFAPSGKLTDEQMQRLHRATCDTLTRWRDTLIERFGERFPGPGDVTAFRPEFAAHGKFGHPCPACGTAIERIRYADRETNYCPSCQTGGKLLADRSLSRLLKKDWGKAQ